MAQVAGDVADAQVADVQQVTGAADLEVLKRLHRRLPGEAFVFANKVIARQGAGGGDQIVQGQPFMEAALQVTLHPVHVQRRLAGLLAAAYQRQEGEQAAQHVGGVHLMVNLKAHGGGEQHFELFAEPGVQAHRHQPGARVRLDGVEKRIHGGAAQMHPVNGPGVVRAGPVAVWLPFPEQQRIAGPHRVGVTVQVHFTASGHAINQQVVAGRGAPHLVAGGARVVAHAVGQAVAAQRVRAQRLDQRLGHHNAATVPGQRPLGGLDNRDVTGIHTAI